MRPLDRGRLAAWIGLVAALATLGYASRAAGGKPPADALYKYSTAASGLIQYVLILVVVLAIAKGDPRRLLALRRPSSYGRVLWAGLLVLAAVYLTSAVVDAFGDPGREQGLTPEQWDPHRAAQYAVNFAVIVLVAPAVEELAFRGLGYSLLEPLGRVQAILWIAVAFGLVHGLLEALPILIVFGAGLAFLRERTGSVYPAIAVHASFNAIALVLAVTT